MWALADGGSNRTAGSQKAVREVFRRPGNDHSLRHCRSKRSAARLAKIPRHRPLSRCFRPRHRLAFPQPLRALQERAKPIPVTRTRLAWIGSQHLPTRRPRCLRRRGNGQFIHGRLGRDCNRFNRARRPDTRRIESAQPRVRRHLVESDLTHNRAHMQATQFGHAYRLQEPVSSHVGGRLRISLRPAQRWPFTRLNHHAICVIDQR